MSDARSLRIYVSTGEASGDLHAEAVVRALRRRFPESTIEATGGPRLAAAGAVIRHSIDQCGAIGAVEILGSIPRHFSIFADLRRRFRAGHYDLLVVVDYPGFHVRLARAATEAGIPVLYYIAPQLWAWGRGRAAARKRGTRELAVILPFEEAFFRGLDIPATFVGHPLLERTGLPTRTEARARLGLLSGVPALGLFPGSRAQETRRLWPAFRDAALRVREAVPDLHVVVAGMRGLGYPGSGEFVVHYDRPEDVLAAADAGLCKSGTTTLQAALADLPMVIAYRLHPWTHALATHLVGVSHIGLVNLVAGRGVSPELLQDHVTPAALAREVLPLLDPAGASAVAQRAAFSEIRAQLGTPGAGERVAEMAARLVA